MNRSLEKLKSVLDKEIDKVTEKGELTPAEIKPLGEIIDIYKDIETICAMEEYKYDDSSYAMSNRGYSTMRHEDHRPDWDNRGMYYDDYSSKRDSRGRYSRNSEKEEMIEKLEHKLRTAKTEEERRYINECIDELERG